MTMSINPVLTIKFSYHILDPKFPLRRMSREDVVLRISDHMTEDEKQDVGVVLAHRRVGPLLFGPIVIGIDQNKGCEPKGREGGGAPPAPHLMGPPKVPCAFFPNNAALMRMLQIAPMHEEGIKYISLAESITTDDSFYLPHYKEPRTTDPFGPAAQDPNPLGGSALSWPHPWATVFGFHILLICIHFGILPVMQFKIGTRQLLHPDDDDESPGPVGFLYEGFHTLHKLRTRYSFLKSMAGSTQPIRGLVPLQLSTPTHTIDRDAMRAAWMNEYNSYVSDPDVRASDAGLPPAITETEMYSIRSNANADEDENEGKPEELRTRPSEDEDDDDDVPSQESRGVRGAGGATPPSPPSRSECVLI